MSLTLRGTRFIYADTDKEQILLDCSDFLSNKSRIPLQAEGQNILELLVGLAEKERLSGTEFVIPSLLIDILITSQLIRAARPFHVLEYGCGGGKLSFHLAELLGTFCEKSSLICAYDTLDMKWIEWKEKISQIKQSPRISYLMGDYCNLQLQKNYFDIILINGRGNYNSPFQTLENALKLLTDEGIIICYMYKESPLESTFRLLFKTIDEYELPPAWKIFLARADKKCLQDNEYDFELLAQSHLRKAQSLLENENTGKKEITDMIKILQEDLKTTISSGNRDLKIRLLDIKSNLIEKGLLYSD